MPPPFLVERKFSCSPSAGTSQSSTSVSSSVHAGLVAHSIPCTPSPEESRSPRIEGPDVLLGKYAKKFGDCQCVTPGKMSLSKSLRMVSKVSPCCGASVGSEKRISPGFACERTENDSIRL